MDASQTTQGIALADTYALGNAYVQQDPKDLVNGIWKLHPRCPIPAGALQIERGEGRRV